MNALIAEPIAKLIMALLIGLGIYFGIKHYNGLNQKIGRLETVLEEKQDLAASGTSVSANNQAPECFALRGFWSLSGILCSRHSMTSRSMYASEQDEDEERGDRRADGGAQPVTSSGA